MVRKHKHTKHKRKAPHHKRRHPLPFNFVSGLVYAAAVILSISLGALFYNGYKNARSDMGTDAGASAHSLDLPPGSKVVEKKVWTQEKQRKPRRHKKITPTPTPPPVDQQPDISQHPAPTESVQTTPLTLAERPAWKHVDDPVMGTLQNITILASADTTLFATAEKMQNQNFGGQEELYLNGNNCFILNNYDVAPIQGWTVHKVTWHGKVKSGRIRNLTFSSITRPWTEGTGSTDNPAQNGATFFWAKYNTQPWDQEGDPAWCAMRGNSQTLCSYSPYIELGQQADEWIKVEIDPLLVQSLIAGQSEGIALFDACGQASFSNTVLYSRETEGSHYLEVEGELIDIEAPGKVQNVTCEAPERLRQKNTTGIVLSWIAGGDDGSEGQAYRYDIRYSAVSDSIERAIRVPLAQIPWPPMPAGHQDTMEIKDLAPATTYNIFIRAVDECGQVGPHTIVSIKTPSPLNLPDTAEPEVHDMETLPLFSRSVGMKVYDENTHINALSGAVSDGSGKNPSTSYFWHRNSRTLEMSAARNETIGFLLNFQRKDKEFPPISFRADTFQSSVEDELPGNIFQFFRVTYQPERRSATRAKFSLQADALVPLNDYMEVPWEKMPLPRQVAQAVYCECHIPLDAQPGLYRSQLNILAKDGRKERLTIMLTVLPVTIPEQPSFQIELLRAPGIAAYYRKGVFNASEANPIEKAYHRIAREHRCCMAVLPYTDDGTCPQPFSPPITGEGSETEISSWDMWDERYESYLDGSAFNGLTKSKFPESHVILPIFENWPLPFEEGYRCTMWDITQPDRTSVYAGPSGEISHCMDEPYWQSMNVISRQFADHFNAKGWQSKAHVFLNNTPTNQYKGMAPRWNLGHPVYREDFVALNAFADTLAQCGWRNGQYLFRVNIPDGMMLQQYGVDLFDLLTVSDISMPTWRHLANRSSRANEMIWLKTDDIPIRENSLYIPATMTGYFLLGATGWSINNTTGRNNAWREAQPESIIYSGAPFKQLTPYPSLRLKALRRAEQDIELLLLLKNKMNWSTAQLTDFVQQHIKGLPAYEGITSSDWYLLRHATQEILAQ